MQSCLIFLISISIFSVAATIVANRLIYKHFKKKHAYIKEQTMDTFLKNQHDIEFCIVEENNIKQLHVRTENGWCRMDLFGTISQDHLERIKRVQLELIHGKRLLKAVY